MFLPRRETTCPKKPAMRSGCRALDGGNGATQDRAHSMAWRTLVALGLCLCAVGGGRVRGGAQRAGAVLRAPDEPADRGFTLEQRQGVAHLNPSGPDGARR